MEEIFDFDFLDDDITEDPAQEVVAEMGAALVGGVAGAEFGAAIGRGIAGAVHKSRHKKELKNDPEMSDQDWQTFKRAIGIARKSATNHLKQAILDGNPNIDEISDNARIDKYVNQWGKHIIVLNTYDEAKVRKNRMCPIIDIKGKIALVDLDSQMLAVLRALRKMINNDLSSAKLPCRMIETNWGGCVMGLQYHKASSAKESIEIPYYNINDAEEYMNNTELTYLAFESALLNYEVTTGICDVPCSYDLNDTEACESTSDETFAFGADLFEEAIASESSPATEGIGTSIANGVKTVLNAIKNFFIRIANGIKNIGKKKTNSDTNTSNDEKKTNTGTTTSGTNSGDTKPTSKPSSPSDVAKIVAQMNTVISILNSEVSNNASKCREIQTRINNAFNSALNTVDRMVGANNRNLGKVGDAYTSSSNTDGTNSSAEKDLDKARVVSDAAEEGVKRAQDAMTKMTQQYMAIMKAGNYETTSLKSDVMKKFNASSISNIQKLCAQIENVSKDNIRFCEGAIGKYTNNEDKLKGGPAATGFELCKVYLKISKTFSSLSLSLTRLCNGSVFGS